MTTISVIVGSTREGRFSEKPARWIVRHLEKRDGVEARLLDLRDFPMPFFDQSATPATPGRPPYKNEVVFVSYGSAMGARSVQQLRETAIELQLAPVRSSVHIPVATLWAHYQGGDVEAGLTGLEAPANALIDDLLWWTAALKTARTSAS